MNRPNDIVFLFEKHLAGTLTPTEGEELAMIIETTPDEELLPLLETLAAGWPPDNSRERSYWDSILHGVYEKIRAKTIRRMGPLMPWVVAAVFIGLIALGAWLFLVRKPQAIQPSSMATDIAAPVNNKARITLADGRTVYLDSASNGELTNINGVQVVKTADGKIVYEVSPLTPDASRLTPHDSRLTPHASRLTPHASRLTFNTLTNPRGSMAIDLTLSDGSHVWLNAGSSVTYPVAFVGNERKVIITGEAYFEVAPDKTKPFYVQSGEVEVRVLGTHFNINAYDDEADIKVTLLEGSVRVSTDEGQRSTVIKPGQQAVAAVDGGLSAVDNIDVEQVMAWKNGFFQFNKAGIETVLKQLQRWYDLDIKYAGKIPDHRFVGRFDRNLSLAQVLRILEKSGVRFNIENRTVTVL